MSRIQESIVELNKGFATAFIDHSLNSNLAYRPEFISNNYRQGRKVLVSIEEELARCEEFCISVAFITKSGLTPLLQILKELENKNIPGKILTTDYLTFSEPAALETLAALKNIELKMFMSNRESGGFHTKGYIFRKEEIYRIIIGSSNMTLNAVTRNREWNTKLVSARQGEITQQILSEFDELWRDKQSLPYKHQRNSIIDTEIEAAVLTALQKEMDLKAESGKICAERKELQRGKADEAQRRLKDMERSLDQLYEDQRESFESYKAGMTEKDTFLQQKQVYEQMEERLKDKIRQQKEAVERLEDEADAMPDGFSADQDEIQADQLTREMTEAFVEKVIVWPGQKLEIRWKTKK